MDLSAISVMVAFNTASAAASDTAFGRPSTSLRRHPVLTINRVAAMAFRPPMTDALI